MDKKNVLGKLFDIQQELAVPKSQYSDFGNFNFRSAEDILSALKPLLQKYRCVISLSDSPVCTGDRYYIVSTATITDIDTGESLSCTSSAREALSKEQMDESQITGASNSYARKYALGGLLAIDSGKDADSLNNTPGYTQPQQIRVSTLDEALAVKVTMGFNKDKTLRAIYEANKPQALFWVANNDPVAGDAAKMVISSDEALMALCKAGDSNG